MASNSDKINNLLGKAEANLFGSAQKAGSKFVQEATQKLTSSTNSEVFEGAKKVASSADSAIAKEASKIADQAESKLKAVLTSEAKAVDKALAELKTREAAKKLVDSSLDKIIDDAVKKFTATTNKSDADFKQQLKDLIRGHKSAFFNADKLIDKAAIDAEKQLDYMIDQKVKSVLDEKMLDKQLRPLNVLLNKAQTELNSKLSATIKLDIAKELDKNLESMLKDPLKDINVTLNKYGLNSLSKELNTQITSIRSTLATNLTKNMAADIAKRQAQIAEVTKKIVEVEKQIKQYEKQIQDKIKELQNAVNEKIKEAEEKLVDEISKSIKLKF